MKNIQEKVQDAVAEASKVIVGKEDSIRLIITSVLAGGHLLLDDLPGAGKTTLVKTLSKVFGCSFSRVQFTPDLLPSDVTGLSVYDQKLGDFRMRIGPVVTNLFLADEINRAIPRTQAALLEAMEEGQVTIDGETIELPRPFLVMATQNPVEQESTFRLPAAQMDRFFMRLSLGYPDPDGEVLMLKTVGDDIPFDKLNRMFEEGELVDMQKQIRDVHISDKVLGYIVAVVDATRNTHLLVLPASPRGTRALYRAGKAWAAINGRDFVTPDDVKMLATHILPHRVMVSGEARLSGKTDVDIIKELLNAVPVPVDEEDMILGGTGR